MELEPLKASAVAPVWTGGQAVHAIELGNDGLLKPGRVRWLRALLWAVLLFFVVAFAGMGSGAAMGTALGSGEAARFFAAVIGALVALGLYAVAVRFGEKRRVSEFALRPLVPELVAGLVIGAAMFAAVMGIMALLGLYDIRFADAAPAWEAAGKAIQSGVVEEVMMRAILLRLIWRAAGPWVAFAVSAALFGFGHIANPNATVFAAICIALEAGIMLAAFYALTGRVWVSIGVHAAWNFTQGYVFGAAVSGGDFGASIARSTAQAGAADWLSGGPFGPEASLPALIVCTSVGAAVLWQARRMGHLRADPLSPSVSVAQPMLANAELPSSDQAAVVRGDAAGMTR